MTRGPRVGCARSATARWRGRRTACPTGGAAAASSRGRTRASASPSAGAPSPGPRSGPSRRRCALAAAHHHQREEGAVGLVGVEPVVGARAHADHRAALGDARRCARTRAPRGRPAWRSTEVIVLLPGGGVRARGRRSPRATRPAARGVPRRTGRAADRRPWSRGGRRAAGWARRGASRCRPRSPRSSKRGRSTATASPPRP